MTFRSLSLPNPSDLPEWLFSLSEAVYAACARGHRAIGVVGGARRSGMINVESIGGSLLIQHYATRLAAKDHVTMVSEASRAYLMHLAPVSIGVVWDMQVIPAQRETSRFRCTIDVAMPTAVRVLGLFKRHRLLRKAPPGRGNEGFRSRHRP